jgi:hypothetical protein
MCTSQFDSLEVHVRLKSFIVEALNTHVTTDSVLLDRASLHDVVTQVQTIRKLEIVTVHQRETDPSITILGSSGVGVGKKD